MERLEIQHQLFDVILSGRLHLAPLDNPQRILDIGTGTGEWVVDMGTSRFLFFSIPPSQKPVVLNSSQRISIPMHRSKELISLQSNAPSKHSCHNSSFSEVITIPSVPANATFLIDDALEQDWTIFPPPISYIHARMMAGSFRDHRALLSTAFSNVSPSGYFESQEIYPTPYDATTQQPLPATHAIRRYTNTLDEAFMAIPKPIRVANKLAKWYAEAGFVDIHEEVFELPLGPWHDDPHMKRIGEINIKIWEEGVSGWAMAVLTRVMGWSMTEVEVWLVNVREALRAAARGEGEKVFLKCFVVWGQKPA